MEKKNIPSMVFLIDFDGTCTTHNFPHVGKEIGAVPVLKRLVASGHKLILFTMRSDNTNKTISADPVIKAVNGKFLTDAVNWFKSHDIPLWGVQKNPFQHTWTDSPKAFGDYMIDDIAIGTPLIHNTSISKQPFVDWVKMEVMLENMGLI